MIPSRIIIQHVSYCKDHESLHRLDNTTAEGTEAFDSRLSMIETLVENGGDAHWGQIIEQAMKEAKRYFKTDFKAHIGRDENSSGHCIVHALSDPANPDFRGECQHPHDTLCDRCDSFNSGFEEIAKKVDEIDITEDQRARMKFESKECARTINAWKAHLIRSVNQEEAKQNALTQLDEEMCSIIIDWVMKYLPQHYRE